MERAVKDILKLLNGSVLFDYLLTFDEVFLVGGAIRDFLLGREVFDFDFVLRDNEFEKVKEFANENKLPNFILNRGKYELLRIILDKYTYDFTKLSEALSEDIEKRDFTINAIYINIKSERVIACKLAFENLKNKALQAVNESSIKADPVRLLRAIRFSAEYNFSIENSTKLLILDSIPELRNVKKERVREEIKKILDCDTKKVLSVLELLFGIDLNDLRERVDLLNDFSILRKEINQDVTYEDLFKVAFLSQKLPFFSFGFEGHEREVITRVLDTPFKESFEGRFSIFTGNRDKLVPVLISLFKAPKDDAEKYAKLFLKWSEIKISGSDIEEFLSKEVLEIKEARMKILKERCLKYEV